MIEPINSNIDYKVIGQRIKEGRKKKNITQECLANLLDVSIEYISRLERGRSKINLKRLAQVSVALDISMAELVTGIAMESKIYLDKEFAELLSDCTPEKQKLIYNIAKAVKNVKFV